MRHIEPLPHAAIEAALLLGGPVAARRIFRAHVNKQHDLSPDEKKAWVRGSLRAAMERYLREGIRQSLAGYSGRLVDEAIHARVVREVEDWLGRVGRRA